MKKEKVPVDIGQENVKGRRKRTPENEKNPILKILRENRSYSFVRNGCPNCGCKYEYDLAILGQLRCGNCHEITADYGDDAWDRDDIVWDEKENQFMDTQENLQIAIKDMEQYKRSKE